MVQLYLNMDTVRVLEKTSVHEWYLYFFILDGIRSLVRQLDSPTVLLRQHEYDMRGISIFLLFSFKLTEETLKHIPFKVIKTT